LGWADPLGLTSCGPAANDSLDWTKTNPRTGETAVDHVMRHGDDMPTRNVAHGVFADDPIATTNSAWDIAVRDGIKPELDPRSGNWNYTIPYPEAGLNGGIPGTRDGNPILNSIRIAVLPGTNKVVTAFPI
jgi:hypothetical protein